jgi:hypothetical protein
LCKTKKSKLLLSFRVQVCHPHTCDRSRLLGPCFKTGRKKPFSHRHRTSRYTSARFGYEQFRIPQHQPHVYGAQIDERKPMSGQRSEPALGKSNRKTCNIRTYSPSTQHTMTPICEEHGAASPQLNGPCGTETQLTEPQPHKQKLASFASLSAISGTFNSLSKVLFIFPSRYLFAIGLGPIFSFRRQLPPNLHTMSKVRDSMIPCRTCRTLHVDGVLTLHDALFQRDLRRGLHWREIARLQFRGRPRIYILSFSRFSRPY